MKNALGLFAGILFLLMQSCKDEALPTEPEVSNKSFQLFENTANGTVVGSVVDEDESSVNFQFSIIGGDPDNAFAIDPSTGEISISNSTFLDYEKIDAFELAVEVLDKKSKLTGVTVASVEIVNVIEIPLSGLVAYYDFSGGSLNDLSGNNNTATNSGVTGAPDRFNKSNEAMSFDSVEDYLKVSNPSFLSNRKGSFATWVKFSSVDHTQYIASVGDEGSIESYLSFIRLDGSKKVLSVYQREVGLANWVEGSTVIEPGKYYFLVMQSDGMNWSIYINGVEEPLAVRSGSNTGKWIGHLQSIDNFVMGSSLIQQPFTVPNFSGIIDNILLYNRTLDECEIEELYTDARP